jgi:2-dehydropantoate 2-reductase
MRVAVLGAGAIGAYLGARLAEGGAEVVLIARGEQLAALRAHGVRIASDEGEAAVRAEATDRLEAVADADVVIVALKAYSLPAIAPRLGALLSQGTATVWAQNGIPWWYFHGHDGPLGGLCLESVDPGGVIAASIPPESAIGCVVYVAAELERPGLVRLVEGRRVSLGEPAGGVSPRCEAISAALQAGGLRAPVVENLRAEVWLKLLGNATFNPISALTGATLAELGELAEVRKLLLECFREIADLAEALGLALPISLERRLEAGIAVGDHKTSMLQDLEAGKPLVQDLEAGKPLEHACMTGALIEIARHVGVGVPRIEALGACVALLDSHARGAGREAGERAGHDAGGRSGPR